ncbi:MAG TPA: hypothetical protein VK497_04945 [Candidatus Saccharimonadales bacterium]|nr:hypothetical protein [Candidatus Saccharimonadales bacterium]
MSTVSLEIATMHWRGNEVVTVRFPANYNMEGDYFGIVVTSIDHSAPGGGESREGIPIATEMFVEPWNRQHVRILTPLLTLQGIEEIRRRLRDEESFTLDVDAYAFQLFLDDMRQMMSL